MGKIIRLAGVNLTDLTAPRILERDPIESDGSLFLFDGSHEFGAFSGLPADGAAIPNALSSKAASILSVPEASTHFSVARIANAAGIFQAERTTNGGIYGLITQGGGQVSKRSYELRAADAIRSYVAANTGRSYYVSLWTRISRIGISNAAPQSPIHMAANTANYLFHFQSGRAEAPSDAKSLGRYNTNSLNDNDAGNPAPFNRLAAMAFNAASGTGPSTSPIEFGVGTFGAWNIANYNKAPSRIIYRAYMEDLTESGRSYADVLAIDQVLYTAAFAPGGKFHGDTYTDPATLP